MTPQIKKQNNEDGTWTDEKGMKIPAGRVTQVEKIKERLAIGIAVQAVKAQKVLQDFKDKCEADCELAYQCDLKEGKVAAGGKGGYTLYNFDRSIKVERSHNDIIQFDENLIGAAKEKFDDFLKEGTSGVDDMIRNLIMDAFSANKKSKLDTKKVLGLLAYGQRIDKAKYPKFHEAMELIEQSIKRPGTRVYYRIFLKDANNAYQNIDLNFSSI